MNPTKVITIYSNNSSSEIYIESQNVVERDKKFYPEHAKAISMKELRIFQRVLNESEIKSKLKEKPFYNVIQVNLLSLIGVGINKQSFNCVWYSHEQKQFLHFPNNHSIPSGLYHLPKLIWKYSNNTLEVYAAFDKEITADTELYGCPFMNIYSNSTVCLGSTKLNLKQENTIEEAKNNIMKGFFKSQFTHFNSSFIVGDPNVLYQKMLKKAPTKSDLKDLKRKIKGLCHTS